MGDGDQRARRPPSNGGMTIKSPTHEYDFGEISSNACSTLPKGKLRILWNPCPMWLHQFQRSARPSWSSAGCMLISLRWRFEKVPTGEPDPWALGRVITGRLGQVSLRSPPVRANRNIVSETLGELWSNGLPCGVVGIGVIAVVHGHHAATPRCGSRLDRGTSGRR